MDEKEFEEIYDSKTELWKINDFHIGKIIEMGYEEHEKNFPSLASIPKWVVAPLLLTYSNPYNKPDEVEQTLRLAMPLDLLKQVKARIEALLDEYNTGGQDS